ncbi:MAG: hypothetical protein H7X92_05355 [Chitinophagales bacterium]|nr:hypothetical protein [Hyphomicrobiales bacterium]
MFKVFAKCFLVVPLLISAQEFAVGQSSTAWRKTDQGIAEMFCGISSSPYAVFLHNTSLDGQTIVINEIIDQPSATVNAFAAQVAFDFTCNNPVNVSLISLHGGLKSTLDGTLTNEIDYVATMNLAGVQSPVIDTASLSHTASVEVVNGANSTNLVLTVAAPKSDNAQLLSDYKDVLVMKISPKL